MPRLSRIYYNGQYFSYPLKAFEALFRTLGLSVDWTTLYTTIDERSRRVLLRRKRRRVHPRVVDVRADQRVRGQDT